MFSSINFAQIKVLDELKKKLTTAPNRVVDQV